MPEGMSGSPARTPGLREKLRLDEHEKRRKSPLEAMRQKPLAGPQAQDTTIQPQPAAQPQQQQQQQIEQAAKPPIKEPSDIDKLRSIIQDKYKGLEEQDRKWMEQQQSRLDELNDRAKQLYQDKKKRVEMAQIADMIGQAFVKLAAAHEGYKTGRDISSGVPFQPKNWSQEYNNVLQEYKMELDSIDRKARGERDIERESSRKRRAATERDVDLLIRDHFTARQAQERMKRNALKGEKNQDKAQEKLDKLKDKNNQKYEQVKGLIRDMDEGRMKDDKAIPRIRKLLTELGHTDQSFQTALEDSDSASWFGSDWDVLYKYVDKNQTQMNKRFGTTRSPETEAGPREAPDKQKVFKATELPDI